MALHLAKCRALTSLCDELRLAIRADTERLSFKLSAENLVSQEARDSKDVGAMVSQVECRLRVDEQVWDKLIQVLDSCEQKALNRKLSEKLRQEEMAQGVTGAEEKGTVVSIP